MSIMQIDNKCIILFKGSKNLLYPSTTAFTSLIFYHKYATYKLANISSTDDDEIILCASILFLAGKATEQIRRIRDTLNTVRSQFGHKPDELDLNQVLCMYS